MGGSALEGGIGGEPKRIVLALAGEVENVKIRHIPLAGFSLGKD